MSNTNRGESPFGAQVSAYQQEQRVAAGREHERARRKETLLGECAAHVRGRFKELAQFLIEKNIPADGQLPIPGKLGETTISTGFFFKSYSQVPVMGTVGSIPVWVVEKEPHGQMVPSPYREPEHFEPDGKTLITGLDRDGTLYRVVVDTRGQADRAPYVVSDDGLIYPGSLNYDLPVAEQVEVVAWEQRIISLGAAKLETPRGGQ